MRHSALERFEGSVPSPFAIYRPAGVGALRSDPSAIGIAHYSALQVMEEQFAANRTRVDALVAAAESATTPPAVLEALASSADERERLIAENRSIEAQMRGERERREMARTAPALAVDEIALAAQAAAEQSDGGPTPFATLGDQLRAVAHSTGPGVRMDAGLETIQAWAAAQGLNESIPSEGGFLVQQDYGSELLRDTYDTGILAGRARRRPVAGGGFRGNAVDESSRADGSRLGGLQAYWTGEAETMTATKPKFRKIQMDLEKLTGVYYATDELLMDGPALEGEVRDWFVEEFGFKLDDAIIRGTGAGMPLGILNSPALVTQAAEGGQAVDTVVSANLQKMFARVPVRSLAKAIWIINQEVWPQLFAMEDTSGQRIYLPAGRINDAPFGAVLGRPVIPSEQASAIGDVGDVIFADLSRYLLIEKGGVQSASSIHVQFLTGETAFRFIVRANGQPIPNAAVTPYKGASTLSPFVALAAR